MKKFSTLCLAAALGLYAVGCAPESAGPPTTMPPTPGDHDHDHDHAAEGGSTEATPAPAENTEAPAAAATETPAAEATETPAVEQ